jgi:hypothetical protein
MIRRPTKYNKLLTVCLIVAAISEIAGVIILLLVDWRIALGVFLIVFSNV